MGVFFVIASGAFAPRGKQVKRSFFRKQAKRCKAKPKQVSLENKRYRSPLGDVSLENKGHRSPLGDVSLEKPNPFEKVDSRLSRYEALKQAEML